MHDWLVAWPALALACGLPLDRTGRPRIKSASQQWKRASIAGAPLPEALFVLSVLTAIRRRLIGARESLHRQCAHAFLDDAPTRMRPSVMRLLSIRAPSCAAIACIPCVSRGSGLPIFFLLSPANVHDAPFARPLLEWAVRLYHIRPRVIQMSAGYWGLRLIAWIHSALGAVAVVPWNRHLPEEPLLFASHLEAREELGKRSATLRFFGRVLLFFRRERPPLCGWSAIARQVALTYTATIIVALTAEPRWPS